MCAALLTLSPFSARGIFAAARRLSPDANERNLPASGNKESHEDHVPHKAIDIRLGVVIREVRDIRNAAGRHRLENPREDQGRNPESVHSRVVQLNFLAGPRVARSGWRLDTWRWSLATHAFFYLLKWMRFACLLVRGS